MAPVDPRSELIAYAEQQANGRPILARQILIWPRRTKSSPAYWVDYCDNWAHFMALPKGLAPVTAAAVLYAIISAMDADENGDQVTFLSYNTIAARAHVNRKSVQRVVSWQKESQMPLIYTKRVVETKGIRHPSYRFTLIKNPLAFAASRDGARAENLNAFCERYRDEAPAIFEVQRQRAMATGDEAQADLELHQGVDVIINRTRNGLPYKAMKPLITRTGSLQPTGDRLSHKTTRAIQTAKAG